MNYVILFAIVWVSSSKDLTCSLSACPDMKKGDHSCDSECMTEYCNYDTNLNLNGALAKNNSDCYLKCTNFDGCDPENLGNGICDESCNTENCGFDWGDCTCSAGCLDSMLGDGKCDEECNNWDCALDNHDCGACAIGCFPTMLGNGVCDPECNNEGCLYDYNDCRCAENCFWTDYGKCKPECLVASCKYDKITQYPNSWCLNTSLAIYSSYQQIIYNNFSYVAHIEDCYKASKYSCTLEKVLSFSKCYKECNIPECNYSNGKCDSTKTPCHRNFNNSSKCLACGCIYGNPICTLISNICVTLIDYSYYEINPDGYFALTPFNDTSSAKNPHIYFFRSQLDTTRSIGDGTYFSPFSLFTNISQIRHAYSTIYLLEGDDYYLQTPIAYFKITSQAIPPYYASILFNSFTGKHIKITTLNNQRVTIKRKIDDSSNSTFWFSLKNVLNLEINNVDFDWQNTISACHDESYCDYCPAITYDSEAGVYYNDRGEIITNFLSSNWCKNDNQINFFSLNQSNLVLNNVTFMNFRSGFRSLIYVENGNLTLNNVTFDNIKNSDGDTSGVIVWNGKNNRQYKSGNLKFENGIVSRLNNGYELKDAINTKGFLYAINITSAVFRNVKFKYNLVFKQSLADANSASLMFLNLFQALWIDSCTFLYNYCNFGLINIQQGYNYYSTEINDLGEIIYSTLNHVYIKNSVFTSNYGKTAGVLYVKYANEIQNLMIENSSFVMNGVENGPLIHLQSSNSNLNYTFVSNITVTMSDGGIISAKHLPIWAKIYSSNFTENYSGGTGVFEVSKMINVELNEINLDSNGLAAPETISVNEIILNYFIDEPSVYLKLPSIDPPDLNCNALSSISNSSNFQINSVNIARNRCKNSSPNLIFSNTVNITIDLSYFSNNYGQGSNGICLDITGDSLATIKNSQFYSNKNYESGSSGGISSSSSLLIENCTFFNNTGESAIYFTGKSLSIISSRFDSNNSPSSNGGAVHFLIAVNKIEILSLSIANSTFINNICFLNGGGIFIHKDSPLESILSLSVIDTIFSGNQALSGSAVYIDDNVPLSTDSSIKNCEFKENEARFSATFVAFYIYGVLSLDKCHFIGNIGTHSSSLSIAIGENTDEKPSKMNLNLSVFRFNYGNTTISVENQSLNSTIVIRDGLFEYNTGSIYSIDNDYLSDKNSKMQNNYSPNSGGVLNIKNSAVFYSENSIYLNNSCGLNGGVASVGSDSQFFCISCEFKENYADSLGGVIYAESDARFFITDSIFTKNTCKVSGSVIFMASTSYSSSIAGSKIIENYAYNEGTIYLSSSQISISSTKFSKNSARKNPGIQLEDSKITILDTEFSNQNGSQGCFLVLSTGYAQINNSNFFNGLSDNSGVAIHATSSSLDIFSSNFSDLYVSRNNDNGGAIYLYEESSIHMEKSIFANTNCSLDSSASTIYISDSLFMYYSNSAILATGLELVIINSKFLDGSGDVGGAVFCLGCSSVTISSSLFSNNTAEDGGAIHIENEADHPESYQLNITSSSFESNIAGNGGAVWANNANLQIISSNFSQNSAEASQTETLQEIIDGIGGSIKISCQSPSSICRFQLSSNYFSNNKATYNGGAISWDNSKPLFNDNIFQNNSAQYGNDIASFPAMIIFINATSKRSKDIYTSSENYETLTLNNIASGQDNNPSLTFALVDDIFQVITTDVSSQIQMQAIDNDAVVSGVSIANAVNGIYNLDGYIVLAQPGSSAKIYIESSAIDTTKSSTSLNTLSMSNFFYINATFRSCEIGEATVGLSCEVCPEFYYNIDVKNSKCLDCPSSAICYGNYTMIPKSGYWRDNKFTDIFWKCPYPPACLGSPDHSNISFTGVCRKGYESNMCHSCQNGYSRIYKNECQACLDSTSNILRWLGIFILLIFISVAIVKAARRSTFQPESFSSIYIKIFWNYLQIMIIVGTFNLNWPYETIKFFYIQTCIDYIGAQLFSFDCFLQSSESKHRIYYDKILITSLTPFFVIFTCFVFCLMIYIIKRKRFKEMKNDYISTCVVLLFLIHPSIINTLFNIFSCKEINHGEFWLNIDLGIRCWDHDHLFYAFLLALPTICIWVIAVPALSLVDLIKNRKSLYQISIKLRYGFLFNGYNSKHYYWEFVVLYHKVILIGCSAFLSNVSLNVQALTVAILLALFLHTQARNEPFAELLFNKAEIFSRLVQLITILSGLFFLADDLDSASSTFLIIFVLILNIFFILYIIAKLLEQFSFTKKASLIISRIFNRKSSYVIGDVNSDINDQEFKIDSFQSIDVINSVGFKEISPIEQDPCPSELSVLAKD